MKTSKIYKALSIVLLIIAVFAVVCGITVTGSGFLDLSNVIVLQLYLQFFLGYFIKKQSKRDKFEFDKGMHNGTEGNLETF